MDETIKLKIDKWLRRIQGKNIYGESYSIAVGIDVETAPQLQYLIDFNRAFSK